MSKPGNFIVCRCEEVELCEIEEAIQCGAGTSQEVKMMTRAGMGTCQGRVCRSLIEKLVREDGETVLVHPSNLTYHKPVRPIHLGQFIEREPQ